MIGRVEQFCVGLDKIIFLYHMGDNTQTQAGGLFTNPNQEAANTPVVSSTPDLTQPLFQSTNQATTSAIDAVSAVVQDSQSGSIVSESVVQDTVSSPVPSVAITAPEPEPVAVVTEPVAVVAEATQEVVELIAPANIEPSAPDIKTHVGDPISLGSLGEFAGINLGSLIQSASSSAISTSTPQPEVSTEGSKTKKIVLIAMSVVGLLLLVGAGVWMMSVMDPLAGQEDAGTLNDSGAVASGDIVSGNQGDSPVLTGELTGNDLTGTTGDPIVDNSGSGSDPVIVDPLTNGGTNNAALVDTKQISEAINAKMKAAYDVAKTAKSAGNTEAAKKALLAYGMMKKMLTKLENGEYTTNDQAFTELSEYQSQVDAAAQLMNGN